MNAGTLAVNGSLASTSRWAARHAGRHRHHGGTVTNGGTLAPGNSIGTLTVNGNFTQNGGSTYQVEVNPRARATASMSPARPPSTAARCRCWPQSGSYAHSTTYTILNATGGVSGTYASVTSNFAFLTPSLSYDANNVFLTLALQENAFAASAATRPTSRRWAMRSTRPPPPPPATSPP